MNTLNNFKGFIASYLLFGLALTAIVTGTFVAINQNKFSGKIKHELRTSLTNEALSIIKQIRLCVYNFSYKEYSSTPTIYSSSFPETPQNENVAYLQCKKLNQNDTTLVFNIWDGKIENPTSNQPQYIPDLILKRPVQTNGFSTWKYRNYTQPSNGFSAGVYIYIEAENNENAANILRSLSTHSALKNMFSISTSTPNGVVRLQSINLAEDH